MAYHESPDFASNRHFYDSYDSEAQIFLEDSSDRGELTSTLDAYLKSERESILSQADSMAYIDAEQPRKFVQAFGLPLAPVEAIATIPKNQYRETGNTLAYYDRSTDTLKLGPKAADRDDVVVHEYAHGTGIRVYTVKVIGAAVCDITSVRSGFTQGNHSFLEEGFSDLMRGMYSTVTDREAESGVDQLPARYIRTVDGEQRFGHWAYAGVTLELLAEKNPEILDTLIQARLSIAGLRTFAQQVNHLSPGLYKDLRDAPFGTFDAVLDTTAERLFGKKADSVIQGIQQSSNATRYAEDTLKQAGVELGKRPAALRVANK
ncbi:MAG TPA: hypothetical protein VLH38_05945 [Patescibacteria group bacterium]|nr:hypothetical protein [Patescibacteria group bacterium]